MKLTSNYGLNKPEQTDVVNIDDLNDNFDTLDTEVKKISDKADENQNPEYKVASANAALSSGEKLSTAFGKIAKALSSLILHLSNKSNPHSVTKAQVGLGNVNDTSDADKPVSAATQSALDTKVNKDGSVLMDNLTVGNRTDGSPVGANSFAQGIDNEASGVYSHAEGHGGLSSGYASHAEGVHTEASGNYAHAEGAETHATIDEAHAEGYQTISSGLCSHSEGCQTEASGNYSHAEGSSTRANGNSSHAEGRNTTAGGYASHSEGDSTIANGDYSHAEGYNNQASGNRSHAEGSSGGSIGFASHSGGEYCYSDGVRCFTHGFHLSANVNAIDQVVFGRYNSPSSVDLFQIGNGTSDSARSNALSISNNGNIYLSGTIYYNPTDVTGSDFNTFIGTFVYQIAYDRTAEEYASLHMPSTYAGVLEGFMLASGICIQRYTTWDLKLYIRRYAYSSWSSWVEK